MNKCESFTSSSAYGLESEINKFLRNHSDIEVISISHAVDNEETTYSKYSALLIYKED